MVIFERCWDILAFIISCYVPEEVPALLGTCLRVFNTLRIEALTISAEHHISLFDTGNLYQLRHSMLNHDISTSLTSLSFYNILDGIKLFREQMIKLKVLRELRVEKCSLWQILPTSVNYCHLQSIILSDLDSLLYLPPQIKICANLNILKIINCNSIVDIKYQEILFLHLAQLQNLQKLIIMNCLNFKEIHPSLKKLKNLTYINFSGNKSLTALNHIHLSKLKTIIMNHTKISYYDFAIYLYADVSIY